MKSVPQELLNRIQYAKINPNGLFNGISIVMLPLSEKINLPADFNPEKFEQMLKQHIQKVHPANQICFVRSCYELKGKPKPP